MGFLLSTLENRILGLAKAVLLDWFLGPELLLNYHRHFGNCVMGHGGRL